MERLDAATDEFGGGSRESSASEGSRDSAIEGTAAPFHADAELQTNRLFRRQVTESHRRRLQGEILIGTEPKWYAAGYAAIAVLVLAGLFLSLASYNRIETASGWLVPQNGLIRLGAIQGGVVEHIYVSEGAHVTAGQPIALLRLSRDSRSGDTGEILERMSSAQLIAAQAQNGAKQAQLAADADAITQEQASLVQQESDARSLLKILENKRDLAKAKLDRSEKLAANGFVTAQSVDDLKAQYLDSLQAITTQRAQISSLLQTADQLAARRAQIPLQIAEAKAAGESTNAAAAQQLQQIKTENSYTVNAPSDGQVMAIPVVSGQSVAAAATVALFRDATSSLEAEVFVPSSSAGLLKVGQHVSIHYQAFPYKQFGSAQALLVSISEAPLTPAEVAASGFNANVVTEPVFRVRARLDKPYMVAYGKKVPLQAGSALDAEIVISHRTLIQWLFDPLFAVARR